MFRSMCLAVLVLAAASSSASAASVCGWLVKKDFDNIYMITLDGRLSIAEDGYEAEGYDNVGDLSEEGTATEFRALDPQGGYICACLNAEINTDDGRVTYLRSFQRQPLMQCDDMNGLDYPN